jgi:coatomer subunit beta
VFSALQSFSGASFLAANLYSRSVFGEDALVNLSVERKDAEGRLSGYIRIRSKTQGIALSLGDRITAVQRLASSSAQPASQ